MNKLEYAYYNWLGRMRQIKHPVKMSRKEFVYWWTSTGKLDQRGPRPHEYCMSLIDISQPYDIGNVKCITNAQRTAINAVRRGIKINTPFGQFDSIVECHLQTGKAKMTIMKYLNKGKVGWSYL